MAVCYKQWETELCSWVSFRMLFKPPRLQTLCL